MNKTALRPGTMKTKFTFLSGDCNWIDYGGKWVSQKLSNGEFNYWLVIEFLNMDDACGRDNEGKPKYNVSLSAVSPGEAGNENIDRATEGYIGEGYSELTLVEALHSYGVSAHLWGGNGDNAHKLIAEAKIQARNMEFLFGFAMDRAVNRIGTTGWEAIKGDITAGLNRTVASGTTEGNILGKMHGTV